MTRINEYINRRILHPTSSGINNIPSLDGVRGVAILMVITCHLFAHSVDSGGGFPIVLNIGGSTLDIGDLLLSGSYGVRLFFILSAFLLFIPYVHKRINGSGKVDNKQFFKRRAMRILPAYLLVIFIFSLIAGIGNGEPLHWINLLLNLFFIHPFFSFRHDIGPDFIPGTWSLVTEVHFYLVLPFIARFFQSFSMGVLTALALIVLSFFYRAFVVTHGASFIFAHSILAHIDQFGLGMLAALIYVKQNEHGFNIPPWVPYVLLSSGILAYWFIFNGGQAFIGDYETLLGMSFFLIILGVVLGPTLVRRLLEWGPLRIVGLISYSMFLLNVMLAKYLFKPLMEIFLITEPLQRFAFNMTVGVVLLFVVSMLSYTYIEKPFLMQKIKSQP